MPAGTLQFFFDYLSPYSYLAWQEVPDLARRHDLALAPTPVLLAALLDAHGHKGPGEIPPKRAYVYKDCFRRASVLGVPFVPPASHPFHPLLALRVTLLEMDEAQRMELVTRLFSATWAEGRDVSTAEVVGTICEEVGIVDALARVQRTEVKQLLRDNTDQAIELGVFGVPSMVVGEELFWGTDSFSHFEGYLAGQDPASAMDEDAWRAVRPSAERRRSR